MRHRKARLRLNRFTSWRRATLVSLAQNLIRHQQIKTTLAKAKAVQPMAEKLISLAKANTLTKKRRAFEVLQDHKLVSLLFNDIASRFHNRTSGFTRIIRLQNRRGDNARLALLEFTELKKKAKKVKEAKPQEIKGPVLPKEEIPREEKKPAVETKVIEKPPLVKKPSKSFLGGLRNIFKKERDSL